MHRETSWKEKFIWAIPVTNLEVSCHEDKNAHHVTYDYILYIIDPEQLTY